MFILPLQDVAGAMRFQVFLVPQSKKLLGAQIEIKITKREELQRVQ